MNTSWFRFEFGRRHVVLKVGLFYAHALGSVAMVTWNDHPLLRRVGCKWKVGA